jgi:tRNA1(Val) A37 N6-methylase TrmN6
LVLSILKNHHKATLVAIDKSETSHKIFSKNAEALGLSDRCQFISADIESSRFFKSRVV